jgi:plasmid stabilization system protein ParE
MRVTLSRLAERDLEAIGDYIAADNPPRALSFFTVMKARVTIVRILQGAMDIAAIFQDPEASNRVK